MHVHACACTRTLYTLFLEWQLLKSGYESFQVPMISQQYERLARLVKNRIQAQLKQCLYMNNWFHHVLNENQDPTYTAAAVLIEHYMHSAGEHANLWLSHAF